MTPRPDPADRQGTWVEVLVVVALFAAPLVVVDRDPIALLAWLTLLVAPVGAHCGRSNGPRGVATILILVGLSLLCWWSLPQAELLPFLSTLSALVGLALVGAAFSLFMRRGFAPPVLAFLAAALLIWLAPSGGVLRGVPWSPAAAALMLDLSPLSLTAESAGVDWMRHPFVYDAVGSASIGPELRSPWGGLAGPLCFVVGCVLLLAVRVTVRSEPGPEGPPNQR